MLLRAVLLRATRRLAVFPQPAELLRVRLPVLQQAGRLLRFSLLIPLLLRRLLPRRLLRLPCSLPDAVSASRIG